MVFVDSPIWDWKGKKWGHMVADDLQELRTFAGRLGMHPGWIQLPPKTRYPHFDVVSTKTPRALEMGAVHVDSRVVVEKSKELLRQHYLELWLAGRLPSHDSKLSHERRSHAVFIWFCMRSGIPCIVHDDGKRRVVPDLFHESIVRLDPLLQVRKVLD